MPSRRPKSKSADDETFSRPATEDAPDLGGGPDVRAGRDAFLPYEGPASVLAVVGAMTPVTCRSADGTEFSAKINGTHQLVHAETMRLVTVKVEEFAEILSAPSVTRQFDPPWLTPSK